MGKTKEERFLIAAYEHLKELAVKEEDMPSTLLTVELIGKKSHMGERGVHGMARQLIRGNFLRKRGEEAVVITPLGINLVKELLGIA